MDNQLEQHGHYFLDEAGDATLFDARGQVLIGTEGCSRFTILGLLDVSNPVALENDMSSLRKALLADPYFKGVASFQPEQRKTALFFHAKDDLPEVRREVYSLLMHHEVRFFAIVQDEAEVVTTPQR